MSDWAVTAATTATAVGTLVLAAATFASVRSAQRAARATEAALLAGIRPALVTSRLDDAEQKVGFLDDHWVHLGGGRAAAEATDDAVYLVISLRNVGNGLAVLDRWQLVPERLAGVRDAPDPTEFRRLTRDIFVASGDLGFWQGTLRDPSDPLFVAASEAIRDRRAMTVDLLYGDHEGAQHMISRFGLLPAGEDGWVASVSRHWNLDRPDPR